MRTLADDYKLNVLFLQFMSVLTFPCYLPTYNEKILLHIQCIYSVYIQAYVIKHILNNKSVLYNDGEKNGKILWLCYTL